MQLKKNVLHVNKKLGQHFLMNENILKKIVQTISLKDKSVIEIGPGIGNLTTFIMEAEPKQLTLIELDTIYANKLKEKYNVIEGNCLDYEGYSDVLIGNLPYNVSTNFIIKAIEKNLAKEMVFLVQKEVAERICSPYKRKNYGFLSVFCQKYFHCEIAFNVGSSSFYPPPSVNSSLVVMKSRDIHLEKRKEFLDFLKKIFNFRRKKMKQAPFLRPEEIEADYFYKIFENNFFKIITDQH